MVRGPDQAAGPARAGRPGLGRGRRHVGARAGARGRAAPRCWPATRVITPTYPAWRCTRPAPRAGDRGIAPPTTCPPDAPGDVESLGYGPLKSGSERAVAAAFPGRHLIVRPGLIAGPHDDVGRLPWWLARLARGGRVLVPGDPGRPVRLTDARDLAAWMLDSIRRKITGAVNVPGPRGSTFGELIDACLAAVPLPGQPPARPPSWSGRRMTCCWPLAYGPAPSCRCGLRTFPSSPAAWEASGERARLAGMRYRPLAETVHDTWGWLAAMRRPSQPIEDCTAGRDRARPRAGAGHPGRALSRFRCRGRTALRAVRRPAATHDTRLRLINRRLAREAQCLLDGLAH